MIFAFFMTINYLYRYYLTGIDVYTVIFTNKSITPTVQCAYFGIIFIAYFSFLSFVVSFAPRRGALVNSAKKNDLARPTDRPTDRPHQSWEEKNAYLTEFWTLKMAQKATIASPPKMDHQRCIFDRVLGFGNGPKSHDCVATTN